MTRMDIHIIVGDSAYFWTGDSWDTNRKEAWRFESRAAAERKYRDLLIRNARLDPSDRMDIQVISW